MSDIDRLLEDYKDDGVEESTGAFTVDFQKAREKLAKFQLTDPHELILKLVQAGNLASSGIDISVKSQTLRVAYDQWSSEFTLQRLADRLASASLIMGDDPLSHLSIGLSAMMGLATDPVRLSQRLAGENTIKTLFVARSLEWEEVEEPGDGLFEISMKLPAQLSASRLGELLAERCIFAPVPILWNGKMVKPQPLEPSGSHRPAFFRENKVLAQHRHFVDTWHTPLMPESGGHRASKRMAQLAMTVDLDPKATIWLCKAGVMAEKKRLDLGVPGMIGVVVADDVPTDLTGSQFLDGEALNGVEEWLRTCGQALLGEAIQATKNIISEAQPVRSDAPVATRHGCNGCMFALLGWGIGVAVISHTPHSSGWIMPNLCFWLLFPLAWVGVTVKKHGCEKDDKSDLAAKTHLLDTLKKYQR